MTIDRRKSMRAVQGVRRAAPAGDFDYERNGWGYSARRRPDPRIAALIHRALGDARTVLNVGAGAGSYEPDDRYVVAVEPSAAMRDRPTEYPRSTPPPNGFRSTTTASTQPSRQSPSTSGATRTSAYERCGASVAAWW